MSNTPEEASKFFGNENASPVRMHWMASPHHGIFKPKTFGQLGDGGSIRSSRDDGWGLRDTEGWYRNRYCRPVTIRDLRIPTREKEFIGWPGGLGEMRHTLALTCDGRRSHLQEDWQVHQESLDTTKERVIGYSCLDAELLGTPAEKCDWANTEFIGYSWLKDDQFAATMDLPLFNAMKRGHPRLTFRGRGR